jgi:hypothetical protein
MRPRLFDYRAVGLAGFLGTPLAGTVLMAVNYRRIEKPVAALAVLLSGAFATGWVLWIGVVGTTSAVFKFAPLALSPGMTILAKALQGKAVERHVREGGRLESNWTAVGHAVGVWASACVAVWLIYPALRLWLDNR